MLQVSTSACPLTPGVHWKTRSAAVPVVPQVPASVLPPLVVPVKTPPPTGTTVGLAQAPPPILYIPYAQFPLPFTNIAVRSTMPQSTVASTLRAELGAIDRDFAGNDVRTLDSVLSRNVEQPRFRTLLLGAFAAVALALAAVGVYGLVAYSVTQRTREIAIRLALGARPAQVAGPIIREGLLLATAGVVAGLVVAYALARVLSSFLFGVEARDPLTFVSVAAVLIVVAFAASYVPSRRALRVDPMTALRIE